LKNNLHTIVDKAQQCYNNITKRTGITLHHPTGIENFKSKISEDVSVFMEFSRGKSKGAQAREFLTIQPKEHLSTNSKAKITITNYLGGQYFLTLDETLIGNNTLFLIESKHTKQNILPSTGDIQDGLLKMILFSNLSDVRVNNKKINFKAVLNLTSPKIYSNINSNSKNISAFININHFTTKQQQMIITLFEEANQNNFLVKIGNSE